MVKVTIAVFMLSVASEEINKALLNSDRIFELAEFKRRGKGNDRVSALTKFNNAMQHQHLKRLVQDGDGNCFFRSVSFLIYGTAAHYQVVRASICEVIDVRRKLNRHFVPNVDIDLHLSKMAKNKTYADEIEVRAASELYELPLEIWSMHPLHGAVYWFQEQHEYHILREP